MRQFDTFLLFCIKIIIWYNSVHGELLLFVEVIGYKVSGAPLLFIPHFMRKQYPFGKIIFEE